MTDKADQSAVELIELAAGIGSAFVSNNSVPVAGLPDLIASVNCAFSRK